MYIGLNYYLPQAEGNRKGFYILISRHQRGTVRKSVKVSSITIIFNDKRKTKTLVSEFVSD